jgi:hypothetical protein
MIHEMSPHDLKFATMSVSLSPSLPSPVRRGRGNEVAGENAVGQATLYFFNTSRSISMPSPGPVGTLTTPFLCSIGSCAR